MNKYKISILSLILISLVFFSSKPTYAVTAYDGEYFTKETKFEFELTAVTGGASLNGSIGLENVGDKVVIELPSSIFGENLATITDTAFQDGMVITLNNVTLGTSEVLRSSWINWFYSYFVLPVEQANDNLFVDLEAADPVKWDKDGSEMTWVYSTYDTFVYNYTTAVLLRWIGEYTTFTFTLSYNAPVVVNTNPPADAKEEGIIDRIKAPVDSFAVITALVIVPALLVLKRKKFTT